MYDNTHFEVLYININNNNNNNRRPNIRNSPPETVLPPLINSSQQEQPLAPVPLGDGLPALPKRLLDRIWADEYIDFTELPPARVKASPSSQQLAEGQVLLIHLQEAASP